MTPRPEYVSVAVPMTQAVDHAKRMLFQPMDLGKWFVVGFCAWLAFLGEGGFPGTGFHRNMPSDGNLREGVEQVRDFVTSNLWWIVPTAIGVVVLGLGVWLVVVWLSSRGRFMFLHNVALDKAEVGEPWHKFAREGNSLFWFRVVLGLIGLVPTLPLIGLIVLGALRMVEGNVPSVAGVLGLVGLGMVLMLISLGLWLIGKLTTDFVVPIMFLRRSLALDAWREFLGLLSGNLGRFLLYLLFYALLAMVIGLLVLAVVLMTCCIAGCFLAIPYLGTVLLLPILIFKRSYSLFYLAQYGPEFNVFVEPAPAAPAAA